MFTGFFDESGLDERSKTFWVAGYVAHISTWPQFAWSWRKALQRANIDVFHMTDFESRQKAFEGWSNERRLELIDELVSIICTSDLYGIGGGIVRDAYRKVIVDGSFLAGTTLTNAWWKEPYLLAFQHCVAKCCNGCR